MTTPVNPTSKIPPHPSRGRWTTALLLVSLFAAIVAGLIVGLLINIWNRKQEAKDPYLRIVKVTDQTTDPQPWGLNWPRQYDNYKKTVIPSKTNFGGGDADPAQKATVFPWLTRMFAGYAFSLDYHDRRGHAYMLLDQEKTRRVTQRPQPGSCLNCHSSVIPTYARLGDGDLRAGFEKLCRMTYQDAHAEVAKTGSMNPVWNGTTQKMEYAGGASGPQQGQPSGIHPVSCVDCHDPATMRLRVNRPPFMAGIKALKEHQGFKDYDVNRDATRQEMRTYVCGQCHVEYYCGPKVPALYPWNNGVKVEEIEAYYDSYKFPDGHRFFDWQHAETGAELLKAQHPEFELWNQGVHARSGVTCADCHMPYERQGAMKVSDHWVRSPLLNIARACQQCHQYPEEELKTRVQLIQQRNYDLLQRAGGALIDMLDAVKSCKAAGATPEQLAPILALHRKAQWRLDFVAAENSMGFHAPQESARILGESIDYFRQGQLQAAALSAGTTNRPATRP